MDAIEIRTADTVGEHLPKFFVETPFKGQANFVMLRLKDKEVRAVYQHGEVGIFARYKLPQLVNTVEESLKHIEKVPPQMTEPCTKIQRRQELICVFVDYGRVAYVAEEKMSKLQYYIFVRELPAPKEYRIFSTKRDMIQALEDKEGFLI